MKKITIIFAVAAISVFATWFGFFSKNNINVERAAINIDGMNFPQSDLAGLKCERAKARPFAVMLSSDTEARPLSGIAEAEMVFEMPVTDDGVTRLMAVFQCSQPKEIGSVRSSRLDFIPLAQGLGAIYAHWGGEKEALTRLNSEVIENINAMKYDGTIFFRKPNIKPPHNGFTSWDLLNKISLELGYGLSKFSSSYQHQDSKSFGQKEPPTIYSGDFAVDWKYDEKTNVYKRLRGSKEEVDKNSSAQVEAGNVVIMKTSWSPINKDYIRVKTVGSGGAVIYKNGQEISGGWEKKTAASQLYFYDSRHQEIKFTPGPIWVEIVVN